MVRSYRFPRGFGLSAAEREARVMFRVEMSQLGSSRAPLLDEVVFETELEHARA